MKKVRMKKNLYFLSEKVDSVTECRKSILHSLSDTFFKVDFLELYIHFSAIEENQKHFSKFTAI